LISKTLREEGRERVILWKKTNRPRAQEQSTVGVTGRRSGRSSVQKSRCAYCILSRKGCDGVKPFCGRCKNNKERCKWPEGNPSRSGLRLMMERSDQQNRPHNTPDNDHNAVGIDEGRLASDDISGAQPVTNDGQVQLLEQGDGAIARVFSAQKSPAERHSQWSLSPGLHDPEQVRDRVPDSPGVEWFFTTEEPPFDIGNATASYSEGPMGLQHNGLLNEQYHDDFTLSTGGAGAGTCHEDVFWDSPGLKVVGSPRGTQPGQLPGDPAWNL